MDTQAMIDAYVECALWAGLDTSREDEGGHNPPLDENYGPGDVSDEAMTEIAGECRDFAEANASDLAGIDAAQAGHDFYLTRNRHGAGFWDRGLGEIGDRLTDAAHVYGMLEFYVGDDGALYTAG